MFIARNTIMNPSAITAGIPVVDTFPCIFMKLIMNGFVLLIR